MSLWLTIKNSVRKAYGDDPIERLVKVEDWARKNSGMCTPEGLIVGYFTETLARDFRNGKGGEWQCGYQHNNSQTRCRLYKDGLALNYWHPYGPKYFKDCKEAEQFTVRGVTIPNEAGRDILKAYAVLKDKDDAIKEAARKAKAEAIENEKKWAVAEELLGMKRDKNGALRPVKTLCEHGSVLDDTGECSCGSEEPDKPRTLVDALIDAVK
jgi:hypothetical protein